MRILLYLFLFSLAQCNHGPRRVDEFSQIRLGMAKSEVIEVAGPPHWSDRHDGMDRWLYYMNPEDKQTERAVYFRHGKVFQKGLRRKPLLTADEEDELKKTKPQPTTQPFQPKYNESQLRTAIKKEVEKAEKGKKKSKIEIID